MSVELNLGSVLKCFEGILPATIATCAADGTPNVSYISKVRYVDADHVALSDQFFNKTTRNLAENPVAQIMILEPVTAAQFRLSIEFERAETEGPLFEAMSAEIEAIASLMNMSDVFRLRAAAVYRVLSCMRVPNHNDE